MWKSDFSWHILTWGVPWLADAPCFTCGVVLETYAFTTTRVKATQTTWSWAHLTFFSRKAIRTGTGEVVLFVCACPSIQTRVLSTLVCTGNNNLSVHVLTYTSSNILSVNVLTYTGNNNLSVHVLTYTGNNNLSVYVLSYTSNNNLLSVHVLTYTHGHFLHSSVQITTLYTFLITDTGTLYIRNLSKETSSTVSRHGYFVYSLKQLTTTVSSIQTDFIQTWTNEMSFWILNI